MTAFVQIKLETLLHILPPVASCAIWVWLRIRPKCGQAAETPAGAPVAQPCPSSCNPRATTI
jgi:hypothetical protein